MRVCRTCVLVFAVRPYKWAHLENIGDAWVYTPRTGHAVVNEDGVFYLFGGTDGAARQSDVHAYNVETNLWQEIRASGRAPPARSGAQAVVWNGNVWFFGGYTKKDGDYFNDVYKYEIATSMWGSVHTLGEAPSKRTDHSVVLFRDSLLVFGGFDGHNRFNDLRELHLKDKRWSQVSVRSQVPRNRFGHTAVIYGHSMYIFGGWDGHDTLQELFEYNISSNMWIQLPMRGTAPRARYRHTAVVCGDAMFTFGGVDKTQYRFPDLHECASRIGARRTRSAARPYSFSHRHWSKVSTLSVQPSARTFHKTVVHEGFMYILGGFDGRRLNDMYRILLRTKSELQRCQKQLADQVSSPPVPTGGGMPSSTGAVGDAQDAAQTLMPEDLWCTLLERDTQWWCGTTAFTSWEELMRMLGRTTSTVTMFATRPGRASTRSRAGRHRHGPARRRWSAEIASFSSVATPRRMGTTSTTSLNSIFQKPIGRASIHPPSHQYEQITRAWSMRPVSISSEASMAEPDSRTCISSTPRTESGCRCLRRTTSRWAVLGTPRSCTSPVCLSSEDGMGMIPWMTSTNSRSLPASGTTYLGGEMYRRGSPSDQARSRYRHSAVVHGCAMFVFGGVDKRQARFADLCEFSFDNRPVDVWRWLEDVRREGSSCGTHPKRWI
ncbi:Leucine-zipper-like transcriptional regulator 1 (LZTR-1) [Durusdinium trenchii]|uniref:Leucine-zipper-like transcriptional regulator 1 (LZTR-1) n=1 Tax=Durusdinium trenchii TaxID=1381693 RepID=A0ABP0MSB4_9DINO